MIDLDIYVWLMSEHTQTQEMALAVTPCEVLCGFRTVQEIATLLRHAPEFAQVVGQVRDMDAEIECKLI